MDDKYVETARGLRGDPSVRYNCDGLVCEAVENIVRIMGLPYSNQ